MVITNFNLISEPCRPVYFSHFFCKADGVSEVEYIVIACVLQSIWFLHLVSKSFCCHRYSFHCKQKNYVVFQIGSFITIEVLPVYIALSINRILEKVNKNLDKTMVSNIRFLSTQNHHYNNKFQHCRNKMKDSLKL